MNDGHFVLPAPETVSMSGGDAKRLIALGSGDAALLYIWILQNRGAFSRTDAARELRRGASELDSALSALISAGLISPSAAPEKPLEPPEEIPEYTAEDIKNEIENGSDFGQLVQDIQRLLGKVLSSSDLIKLFGIYNDLHLPPEVILMLSGHCIEECRAKYGPGRPPTMRYIEKEAFIWEREAVYSIDLAEAYLKRLASRRSASGSIKAALQIKDRELTASEQKYVDSWLQMGFGPEAAEIAFDRTVLKTGKLAWGYMNSILKSWHEKGLHTAAQINAGDSRKKPAPAAKPEAAPTTTELERMKRMLKSIGGE